MNLYLYQGNVEISGGLFQNSLQLSPSATNGAVPVLTIIGPDFTINGEAVDLNSGIFERNIDTQGQLFGLLRGTLKDGNTFQFSLNTLQAGILKIVRDESLPPGKIKASINSLASTKATCTNHTTLQSITFDVNDTSSIDCKLEGLTYSKGDSISVTILGKAD